MKLNTKYSSKRLLKSLSTKNIGVKDPLNSNSSNDLKYDEIKLTPLSRKDFDMKIINSWIEIRTSCAPKRRSFHVSFIKDNYLYIYGGKDISEGKLNDMWRLNLSADKLIWEEVTPTNNKHFPCRAHHTATEVNGKVYIIGGQNEYNYQTNNVYVYDISTGDLNEITDFGEQGNILPNLEQHSAMYNPEKNEIIIFGGFTCGYLSNKMYIFDIESHSFTEVNYTLNNNEPNNINQENDMNDVNNIYEIFDINVPKPRCGHSVVLLNNSMIVFGGTSKDGELLDDIWQYTISSCKWDKLSPEIEHPSSMVPIPFEQNKLTQSINSTNVNMSSSSNWPHRRSGQSICVYGNYIYLFGGKVGILNETNDFWKYNIQSKQFEIIHDTLLEQYSQAELDELSRREELEAQKKKNFRLLSKKEIEDRLNPFSKKYVGVKGKQLQNQIIRSQSTVNMKNKYEKEIFANSGFHSMKYSSIYTLDDKGVQKAITDLNSILPFKIGNGKDPLTGHVPLPRDGQTMNVYGDKLIVFGGDRNKYPFNDLFYFNLVQA